MFQDPAMLELKEDFRNRFRNVSRLMDCVGCDKCRLWGKLQTAGYGAALKVLFEFDETKNGENPHLRRTELVALVNTLARISHSLSTVQHFRAMVDAADRKTPAEPPIQKMLIKNTDDDDIEDEFEDERPEKSLGEEIRGELDLVWRAYKYVLSSWISLPFKT